MLFLFYEGGSPIGIFDFYSEDAYIVPNTVQGGMLGFFKQVKKTDVVNLQLGDGFDEWGAGTSGATAYGVKTVIAPATLTNGVTGSVPLVLLDDGDKGYGLTFGHIFGMETPAGSTADYKYYHAWREGRLVGPNTMAGSGKVTGWFRDGLYGTDIYYGYAPELTVDGTPPTLSPGDTLTMAVDSATTYLNTAMFSTDASAISCPQAYFVSFLGDPSLVSTSFPDFKGADTAKPIMLFMWKQ